MSRLKVFWLAIVGFAMGVIAWIVGKQTPHVLAAKLRANRARARQLETDLLAAGAAQEEADAVAEASASVVSATRKHNRIQTLNTEADDITGELRAFNLQEWTDDAFAKSFNGKSVSNDPAPVVRAGSTSRS